MVSLDYSVSHFGSKKFDRSDGVIVTWNYVIHFFWITVSINDTYQWNTKDVCFLDCDTLFAWVNDEDDVWNFFHVLDTTKVLFQFLHLVLHTDNFFFCILLKRTVSFHTLKFFKSLNTSLNSFEVSKHTTKPSLINVEHTTSLSFSFNGLLCLLLSTYKKYCTTFCNSVFDCVVRIVYKANSFLKVDDVDAITLSVDVLLHFRVPSSCLVSEVNTCFKQLLH